MKDPDLNGSEFKRDVVIQRSVLVKPEDIVNPQAFGSTSGKAIICGTEKITVRIPLRYSDFSGFNSLTVILQNLSKQPLLVAITLAHGANGSDLTERSTSFSGGREILDPGPMAKLNFPAESFGVYGKPGDWKNITGMEINFSNEKFSTGPKDFKIEFHGIEAHKRMLPEGPRLTASGLKSLLIDEVADRENFLGYSVESSFIPHGCGPGLQNRVTPFSAQDPAIYVTPPHFYPFDTAEELINGRIMGQNIPQDLPWNANPLGELEWTHFLNRHHFLRSMILEFVGTGNESIVERLAEIVADWVRKCPVPIDSNGGAGPTWETLTTAWRLREWLWIRGALWPSSAFPEEVKELMLRSIWEHAQSLMDHQGHPNNWLIVESTALTLAGMLFPLFRDSSKWVETGLSRLVSEHNRQFFSDGAHFEISPLYHSICINALLEVRHVAEISGASLPQIFYEPLEKSFEYLMGLARPDFTWPSINDSGSIDRDYCQLFVNAASIFNRPDFEWVATRGKSGKPPERNMRLFPDAGICVINRTDKNHQQWALFRAGPAGAFHVHNDLLSIEIFDDGTLWLVDPGITRYAPGMSTSNYRSALTHNVVVIDGIEPQRMSRPILERINSSRNSIIAFEGQDFTAVTGRSNELTDVAGNVCPIKRTLILLKKGSWIILEHMFGSGFHEVIHNWQFSTDVINMERVERNIIMASGETGGLVIRIMLPTIPIEIDSAYGSTNPPKGWVSVAGTDQPAHSARYRTKTMLPTRFCWLITKLKNNEKAPVDVELGACLREQLSIIVHYESDVSETLNVPIDFW